MWSIMPVTLASLKNFYRSPLGKKLAQDCAHGLARLSPPGKEDIIMGLGYTRPYLEKFAGSSRSLVFIPAAISNPGIEPPGPAAPGNNADKRHSRKQAAPGFVAGPEPVIVEEDYKFPLNDAAVECVLAVHALEFSPNAPIMLRELWRILVPNGRLILIVPNRRGLWAHAEKTPFGHGQPYSRRQLAEILSGNGFDFGEIYEYAHFLPHKTCRSTLFSQAYEKLAKHFFPYFGGVLMVEAQKRLYNPLLTANTKRRLSFLPDFAPQTARLKPQNFAQTAK
ncbi:MAG: methyltransferase domain-containing protein [Candidatus Tokpelaia sp.]|nr:MAG: methyltransferase domain-containing protein [Candidatus Tokpelaia sp.]KAA6206209.1 MAG: methyltransferase domain-containing protein [Candidatus Tokpelaia sp.]